MELTHPITGATKRLSDGTSEEDLRHWLEGGWRVAQAPAEVAADEPADEPAPTQEKAAEETSKQAKKKESRKGKSRLEIEAEETGHAGLQEDEGASTAPTGSDGR